MIGQRPPRELVARDGAVELLERECEAARKGGTARCRVQMHEHVPAFGPRLLAFRSDRPGRELGLQEILTGGKHFLEPGHDERPLEHRRHPDARWICSAWPSIGSTVIRADPSRTRNAAAATRHGGSPHDPACQRGGTGPGEIHVGLLRPRHGRPAGFHQDFRPLVGSRLGELGGDAGDLGIGLGARHAERDEGVDDLQARLARRHGFGRAAGHPAAPAESADRQRRPRRSPLR